jgi:hypothetical protein
MQGFSGDVPIHGRRTPVETERAGESDAPLEPQRLIITPAAAGCKRFGGTCMLDVLNLDITWGARSGGSA